MGAKHDAITEENDPYIANGSMRMLRAVYNHARKANRELPADNPVGSIDWNGEKRRDTGMGLADLKGWFLELAAIDNPIRREFHLFTLLSACRPAALKEAKHSHLDLRRRVLHVTCAPSSRPSARRFSTRSERPSRRTRNCLPGSAWEPRGVPSDALRTSSPGVR